MYQFKDSKGPIVRSLLWSSPVKIPAFYCYSAFNELAVVTSG